MTIGIGAFFANLRITCRDLRNSRNSHKEMKKRDVRVLLAAGGYNTAAAPPYRR